MTFGDAIDGFKYIEPKNFDEGFKTESNNNLIEAVGLSIHNGALRFLTQKANGSTQKILSDISKIMGEIYNPKSEVLTIGNYYFLSIGKNRVFSEPDEKWKDLRVKLEELYIENSHTAKSFERGWRDIVNGNKLKTGFKDRIQKELIEPLHEYISNKESLKPENKESLLSRLNEVRVDTNLEVNSR